MNHHAETPLLEARDPQPRFVRFGRVRDPGFVEFSFGVGSPDLMVDLVLPLEDYREFCRVNQVTYLTVEQEREQDHEQAKWRYGTAGVTE